MQKTGLIGEQNEYLGRQKRARAEFHKSDIKEEGRVLKRERMVTKKGKSVK